MRVACTSVSEEYLLARLHGMWSKAAKGERLRKLVASTTPEILQHNLQEYGIDASNRTAFYQSLMERQFKQLTLLQRLSTEEISGFYSAFRLDPWYENLKTVLHAFIAKDRREDLAKNLMKIPGVPDYQIGSDDSNWKLPPGCTRLTLERAKEAFRKDGDYLGGDLILDEAYYRNLRKQIQDTPTDFRETIEDLLAHLINIWNIDSLIRNAKTYHLPAKRMSELWLSGGAHLSPTHLTEICQMGSVENIIAKLPEKYQNCFADKSENFSWEEQLLNDLHRRTIKYFMDFTHPLYSMAAYPLLLYFETLNLGRIYESVYFAIPADDIMKMMTGE